ncbi:hypothetical protein AOLI_G00230930 [Acnodon oligacanthus]
MFALDLMCKSTFETVTKHLEDTTTGTKEDGSTKSSRIWHCQESHWKRPRNAQPMTKQNGRTPAISYVKAASVQHPRCPTVGTMGRK